MDMAMVVDLVVMYGVYNHSESGGHEWTMDMPIIVDWLS